MRAAKFGFFILGLVIMSSILTAQDTWAPLGFLEGTWEGTGEGMSGKSTVIQTFSFILGGKYLKMETRAEFKPQEQNPDGEIHEDLGIFSFDSARKTFVLRGFYVEGFVNRYVLEETDEASGSFRFVTESVENAPPGTQAKLVFKKVDAHTLEQSFYVAFPGREMTCYSVNTLKKKN